MFTPAYGHGANNAYSQFQSFPSTSTHPQQQQYPQQPHAQPNFAQWGVNPATAQLGMQLGQSAVAAGQEYVQKNVRLSFYAEFKLFVSNLLLVSLEHISLYRF